MADAMQYQADFCKANNCTPAQFEAAFVAFMQAKPNTKDYRKFARRWGIKIHRGLPGENREFEVVFSVLISSIKVMAKSNAAADEAMREILSDRS